jgi:hypothetical protein
MKERLVPLAAALLRPLLRRCDMRLPLIETMLDLQLTPSEYRSIRISCERSDATLGEYYLWKIAQLSVIASVRRLSKKATRAMVAACDHSDYQPVLRTLEPGRGLLVATPHHGHFVLSIIGLVEHMLGKRQIFVFYEAPAQHSSNSIFDVLYERLFGDLADQVGILHNNRQGLARAIRQLKRGSVVVILPDVFKDVHETYQIPLFGSSRNVMLGTALLARRTGAGILPMVSQPFGDRMDFSSRFGELIEPFHASAEHIHAGLEAEATVHADYRTMSMLFAAFEPLMAPKLIHWQYSRSHFAQSQAFMRLTGSDLDRATGLFFEDPRVRVDLGTPLQLD